VKAIELKRAKRRLSAYAKMAYDAPVLLTSAGKPYVVMSRAAEADLGDLAVGSNPAFRDIMERSEARYRAEGGLSTEEVRSRLGVPRRAARRPVAVRKARRKAVARLSHNPRFVEIVNRSWASYKKNGGVSLEEMQRRHGPERKAGRRRKAR
jgi:hypothetical protein